MGKRFTLVIWIVAKRLRNRSRSSFGFVLVEIVQSAEGGRDSDLSVFDDRDPARRFLADWLYGILVPSPCLLVPSQRNEQKGPQL